MKKASTTATAQFFAIALTLLVLFQSCTKNNASEAVSQASQTADITALTQAVAASAGVSADKVQYLKNDKEFVVDGDALVSLADAQNRFTFKGTAGAASQASQLKSPYLISTAKVSAVTVYCDATVPAVWVAALDSAISNWNASGSRVFISRVTTTIATTKVTTTINTTSTIATTSLPDYYGNPGSKMTINTYYNNMDASKKIFAMTHELGHALGLNHTNGTSGTLISGTPTTDAYSVMNSVCSYWSAFTAYDLVAIQTVYPR